MREVCEETGYTVPYDRVETRALRFFPPTALPSLVIAYLLLPIDRAAAAGELLSADDGVRGDFAPYEIFWLVLAEKPPKRAKTGIWA